MTSTPPPSSPDKPANPFRRHALTAGVAAAATAAGITGSWWMSHNTPQDGQTAAAGGLPELWGQQFDTPTGEKLVMQSLRGKPLLINFWATWCPPCVDELPLLERFYVENKAKSIQMVGLVADKPEAVAKFLLKMPLSFPIGLVGMPGIALSKSWGNLVGGLPFSVMLAADGHVMQRKMGKLSESDLQLWAQSA